MTITVDSIRVSTLPSLAPNGSEGGKPAHWEVTKGTAFRNPWPSYNEKTLREILKFCTNLFRSDFYPKIPHDIETQIGLVRPTWGVDGRMNEKYAESIKATWLGHACFLVELPVRPSVDPLPSRGARILFDPVFSDRCSPVQWLGPRRFTKCPCQASDVPEIDAIVISHNHYDHLDVDTIKALFKRPRPPHLFVPLGNGELLRSIGIPKDRIHTFDWWDRQRVEVEVDGATATEDGAANDGKAKLAKVALDITCTPAQHQSSRYAFDRYKTLWSSWALQEVLPSSTSSPTKTSETNTGSNSGGGEGQRKEGVKVYFAGDTGYRSVPIGADEEAVPTCPAFKEIGDRIGGFDLALIPIGAYLPREFMSPIHCAPQDSVRIFKDIRAKKGLGMHWGTWTLTTEDVMDPPRRLAEECKKNGIPEDDFRVCKLGETVFF